MQNQDFSPRLRGRRAGPVQALPDGGSSVPASFAGWRLIGIIALVAAGASFIGGLSLGLRLGRYGQEEDRIVRNAARSLQSSQPSGQARGHASSAAGVPLSAVPEQTEDRPPRSGREQMANSGREPAQSTTGGSTGRYVILLGSYSPEGAGRLYRKLKGLRELREVSYQPCRAMSEAPNHEGIFQLTHPHNRALRRVYVGCHSTLRDANRTLGILKGAGLLDSTNAQLIDIE